MILTYDVWAEVNPAYCAYVLTRFTGAYLEVNADGPDYPDAYLSLPIALSGDLAACFGGTNRRTGLLAWLDRHPEILVGLTDRLNGSLEVVTRALRFGCFSGLIAVNERARLTLGARELKAGTQNKFTGQPVPTIRAAERLGYWFAGAGSTKAIFNAFGLSV